MAYTRQDFVDGQVLKAEHLNAMEEGIEWGSNRLDNHAMAIETLQKELDDLEVYVVSRAGKGYPIATPSGELLAIFVRDDGTLYTGPYIEEEEATN